MRAFCKRSLREGSGLARVGALGVAALVLTVHPVTAQSAGLDGFPITIDNCGYTATYTAPPERIFSLRGQVSETLLALGMAENIVGTSGWNGAVLSVLAEEYEKIGTPLSNSEVSLEAVLDLEPDFIIALFASQFSGDTFADRAELDTLGITTYVSPTDCFGRENSGADVSGSRRDRVVEFDVFFDEVRQLSQIMGHPERGEAVVADLEARLQEAGETDFSGVRVLVWYSDSEAPYVAGCCGAAGLIAQELHLDNVFAESPQDWPQVSWEAFVESNPDVIIFPDLDRGNQMSADSVADKIAFLESNPVTREMDAVLNQRYIVVENSMVSRSIGMIYGVQTIAEELQRLGFGN